MGILITHLNVIAIESLNHPIVGDVLTLGQQAVYTDFVNINSILLKHKIKPKVLPDNFDIKNKIPHWVGTSYEKNTNAQTVLSLFGASNVYACDGSNYENPDFVFDLNFPVESKYRERFDCILDVGTLEHVFDISTALSNVNFMLKKGGQLILILPTSNAIDHGFYSFSPTLLFDFFIANGYQNFSCYLREGNPFNYMQKGKLYKYLKTGPEIPFISKYGVEVIFFATKTSNTNSDKIIKPFQSIYKELYKNNLSKTNITVVQEPSISDPKNTNILISMIKRVIPKLSNNAIRSFIKSLTPQLILNYYSRKSNGINIIYIGKY